MGIFASDNELAFDLDDLKKLLEQTKTICDDLKDQRDALKKGLEQLRTDWQTPAGRYFFENLDSDWESQVNKFIATISQFETILDYACGEFQKVEDKANAVSRI